MTTTNPRADVPERIRVIIRPGKDDWIGIAYAANVPQSDTIHEFDRVDPAREAAVAALVEAAEVIYETVKNTSPTWFVFCDDVQHSEDCQCQVGRLRAAIDGVKGGK